MNRKLLAILPVLIATLACNLPSGVSTATPFPSDTPTPAIATATTSLETATPAAPSTPQDPLVLRATLCWQGPGPVYPVVSGLKINERVTLLGRGSINGWYVVDNPIYHDPCWVQASDLQLDPGIDLLSLRVFTPPPTPTPTRTFTPTYTPTP
jgi:hypothetical protein